VNDSFSITSFACSYVIMSLSYRPEAAESESGLDSCGLWSDVALDLVDVVEP
jgi:hypothetical protein